MKSFKGTTALITGASSGIGEAFARNFAARHANLILIARSEDKLHKLAKALTKDHGISVHVFPGDMNSEDIPQRLYSQIKVAEAGLTAFLNGKSAIFLNSAHHRRLKWEKRLWF